MGNKGFFLTRRVARAPEAVPDLIRKAQRTLLIMATLTAIAIFLYVWFLDGRTEIIIATAIAALTMWATAQGHIFIGVFHGLRRMHLEVPAVLSGRLVFLLSQVALLAAGYGIVALFGARLAAALITWAVLTWTYLKRVSKSSKSNISTQSSTLFAQVWPFEATVFIAGVYTQVDVLMLKALTDNPDTQIGWYRAAAFFLLQLPFIANILVRGVYPRMAQHLENAENTGKELTFILRILLLISIPIAIGGMGVAEPLIVLIGGTAYIPAVPALLILLPAIPLRFLNATFGMTLSALNRQKRRARIDLVGAIFNIFGNLLIIPFYGFVGAALTTLMTDVLLCLLLGRQACKLSAPIPWGKIMIPIMLAATIMAAVVWLCAGWPVLIRIGLGALIYMGVTYGSGVWGPKDFEQLKKI